MALAGRSLPIVDACPSREIMEPDAKGRAWCEGCSKAVHVLGRMHEDDVKGLFAARRGEMICIEYRVDDRGMVVFRRPPAARHLAPALVGLAACASAPASEESVSPDAAFVAPDAELGAPVSVTPTGMVAQVDFTIDPEDTIRRGMFFGVDPWHRSDRPDRLVYKPTKTLWREMIDRWRARRASR
jgi:hypothetical protein